MDSEDCKSLHPGSIPGQASTFPLGETPSEDLATVNRTEPNGAVRDSMSRPNPEPGSGDVLGAEIDTAETVHRLGIIAGELLAREKPTPWLQQRLSWLNDASRILQGYLINEYLQDKAQDGSSPSIQENG
jgi:hypothetical protein